MGESACIDLIKAISSTHVDEVRKQLGNPLARLAVLFELPLWPDHASFVLFAAASLGFDGDGFAVELIELGLVVERVDMARPAIHEEEDDALRFGGKMRLLGREGIFVGSFPVRGDGLTAQKSVGREQSRQRRRRKTAPRLPQEFATRPAAKRAAISHGS